MARFERKYTHDRQEAIYRARFELGWTYQTIEAKARAGQLPQGDPYPADWQYIGRMCREEEARRKGKVTSGLAQKPARDAVEVLRQRLVTIADHATLRMQNTAQRHPDKVDIKRAQELARLTTYVSTIPARNEEPPPAPGQQVNGKRPSGERIRSGPLLAAMRQEARNGESPAGEAGLPDAAAGAS